VILAMLHSKDFFYAAIVPLILYGLDFLLRFQRRWCRTAKVSATVYPSSKGARVTKLVVQTPGFTYKAGDYVFLYLPQVSSLQWHPFSISSAPSEAAGDSFTFHILDMGPGTFTNEVANVGAKITTARVDGPYGRLSMPLEKYQNIFLAAGGIGVTPMMAVLSDIHARFLKGELPHLRAVHLVWISRHKESFDIWFPDVLKRVSTPSTDADKDKFVLKLYLSGGKDGGEMDLLSDSEGSLPITKGRPRYDELLGQISAGVEPFSVAVLACGPEPMVADVQSAAVARDLHFHKETFVL